MEKETDKKGKCKKEKCQIHGKNKTGDKYKNVTKRVTAKKYLSKIYEQ